jgi:hypothetical protein
MTLLFISVFLLGILFGSLMTQKIIEIEKMDDE